MLKKHLVKLGIVAALVAGAGIGAAIVVAEQAPCDAISIEKKVMRPIPTAVALPAAKNSVHLFPGEVRANRRVELAFSVSGLLEELYAQEGRTVKKGQVIAKLDQRDFQYAYDAAQAKCGYDQRELERFSTLWKKKVISVGDFENAKADYDVALSEMRLKKKALADTVLFAPFNGVVVTRHVEDHEHVKAQQPVLSLQDISTIEVLIQVPERLIAQEGVQGFKHLEVHFDADKEPQRWLKAGVREYSAVSDAVTRTYEVVVVLPPPAGLKLYPGMTATVRVRVPREMKTGESEQATLVPVEALWCGEDGKSYVWIIPPDGGSPKKQLVEAAPMSGANAVIKSGLRPGARVAVAGVHSLREDQPVRPVKKGKEGLDG